MQNIHILCMFVINICIIFIYVQFALESDQEIIFGAKLLDYRDYNYKIPTYNN